MNIYMALYSLYIQKALHRDKAAEQQG